MNPVANFVTGLSDSQIRQWADDFMAYASVLGIQMANRIAPCTLHPSPIPSRLFELGKHLSPLFNVLCDRIEHHPGFLKSSLARVVETDDFTKKLLFIYDIVLKEGIQQKLSLYIDRSDYMLHNGSMKQVELNTICSAFAGLSQSLSVLHRFLLGRSGVQVNLPENLVLSNIAKAVAEAVEKSREKNAIMLMVVQPNEKNSIDQHLLEMLLWKEYRIVTIRRTLEQIYTSGVLDDVARSLIIDGKHLVGVVYFRAGYTPKDYPSEKEWNARLLIERSRAIKCPTVAHQLAGTKKVQQVLCLPDTVESLLPDYPQYWPLLRSVFAEQWGLDSTEMSIVDIEQIIQKAILEPERFVLKPQREGGGNNFFDAELATKLQSLDSKQRLQYVLMERFQPIQNSSLILKDGEIAKLNSVSEFGFFSIWLGDGTNPPLINEYGGHLVRSKPLGTNEGGVAAGYAFLDAAVII